MSDVLVDVAEASRALRGVANSAGATLATHTGRVPHFPPHAAGKAFAHHAARLQAALTVIHDRGTQRFTHAESIAHAAVAQFAAVAQADDYNAEEVGGIGNSLAEVDGAVRSAGADS